MIQLNVISIITLLYVSIILTEVLFYLLVTKKFIANAARTTATVVSSKLYRATKSSVHIPTITFMDESGQAVTAEARLSGVNTQYGQWKKEGDQIIILYDKKNPTNFIADNWRGRLIYTVKRSAITLLIVIVLGILAVALS